MQSIKLDSKFFIPLFNVLFVCVSLMLPKTAIAQGEPIIVLERYKSCKLCAHYELRIFRDGSITYDGKMGVSVFGLQYAKVNLNILDELVRDFETSEFLSLDDKYINDGLMDAVVSSLTFNHPDVKKTVKFQAWGGGAPRWLAALSNKVDEVAGSKRWLQPR